MFNDLVRRYLSLANIAAAIRCVFRSRFRQMDSSQFLVWSGRAPSPEPTKSSHIRITVMERHFSLFVVDIDHLIFQTCGGCHSVKGHLSVLRFMFQRHNYCVDPDEGTITDHASH